MADFLANLASSGHADFEAQDDAQRNHATPLDMHDSLALRSVLAHFETTGRFQTDPGVAPEALGGAGGFSGARFWRLAAASGTWCVRRWPREHPSPERLRFIHAVLDHVFRRGFVLVPRPLRTRSGATFVELDGRLWEVAPWMPGKADYHVSPTAQRLAAALTALAEFHLAAATFSARAGQGSTAPTTLTTPSPGLRQRLDLLKRLRSGECEQVAARILIGDWPELAVRARRVLSLFDQSAGAVARELERASHLPLPQQPAIRDIWHDHVLFEGERVSGLVDFGALRVESVAGDVARLLGSLAGDDSDDRRAALAAYEALRPLSADERLALAAFDHSTTLLSGMNWLRWVYLEGRTFDDRRRVEARLDAALSRLERLALHCAK